MLSFTWNLNINECKKGDDSLIKIEQSDIIQLSLSWAVTAFNGTTEAMHSTSANLRAPMTASFISTTKVFQFHFINLIPIVLSLSIQLKYNFIEFLYTENTFPKVAIIAKINKMQ